MTIARDERERAAELQKELQAAHAGISDYLARLARLANASAPPPAVYAEVRWMLTKWSRKRWRLIDAHVFPLLERQLGSLPPECNRLKQEAEAIHERTIEHVSRWPLTKAISDWDAYTRASKAMRADMRDRIEREKQIIGPALAELSARRRG